MDLKKLYADVCVYCRKEIPLYDFFLYCDIGARTLLAKYPAAFVLPDGAYTPPAALADGLPLHGSLTLPMLYFTAGKALSDAELLEKGYAAAEDAYRTYWKAAAKGKHRKGDNW